MRIERFVRGTSQSASCSARVGSGSVIGNALRGHLGEYGITAPQGPAGVHAGGVAAEGITPEPQRFSLSFPALFPDSDSAEHLVGRDSRLVDVHSEWRFAPSYA